MLTWRWQVVGCRSCTRWLLLPWLAVYRYRSNLALSWTELSSCNMVVLLCLGLGLAILPPSLAPGHQTR